MKTVNTLICAGSLLLSTSALAKTKKETQTQTPPKAAPAAKVQMPVQTVQKPHDTADHTGKAGYPHWYVHRPLVLPESLAQVDSTVAISTTSAQTNTDLNLGFDMGLAKRLQGGLLMSLPLSPDGGFGMLVGNIQYGLASFANLRFDMGASKLTAQMPGVAGTTTDQTATGFVWGVGVPMKWHIADRVALTTGRSTASAFGMTSKASGLLMTSDDLVTMSSGSFTAMNGSTLSTTVWTFGLPVGMVVQAADRLGLGLRTGFRVMHGDGVPDDTAIPVAFDLMTRIARPLDLGFTFELPGWTSDYGAVKDFNVWAQARF